MTEIEQAEARKRLATAFRRGLRKAKGYPMDWEQAYRKAEEVMAALPQIYGLGERADIDIVLSERMQLRNSAIHPSNRADIGYHE